MRMRVWLYMNFFSAPKLSLAIWSFPAATQYKKRRIICFNAASVKIHSDKISFTQVIYISLNQIHIVSVLTVFLFLFFLHFL